MTPQKYVIQKRQTIESHQELFASPCQCSCRDSDFKSLRKAHVMSDNVITVVKISAWGFIALLFFSCRRKSLKLVLPRACYFPPPFFWNNLSFHSPGSVKSGDCCCQSFGKWLLGSSTAHIFYETHEFIIQENCARIRRVNAFR